MAPYTCLAIWLTSSLLPSPIRAITRVLMANCRVPKTFGLSAVPETPQRSGVFRSFPVSGSASGSEGERAEAAARAAWRAALKPYRKSAHGQGPDTGRRAGVPAGVPWLRASGRIGLCCPA